MDSYLIGLQHDNYLYKRQSLTAANYARQDAHRNAWFGNTYSRSYGRLNGHRRLHASVSKR